MNKHSVTPPAEPGDGTVLQQVLTYRLARVQAKLNAQGTRILRANSGLSLVQWRILTLLGRLGDSTSTEIAKTGDFDKGLLSRKLKTLIADGLVHSVPHETDNRVQILSLTKAGRDLHDSTLPHMNQRQTQLTEHFSAQELAVFFECLGKLERAADNDA